VKSDSSFGKPDLRITSAIMAALIVAAVAVRLVLAQTPTTLPGVTIAPGSAIAPELKGRNVEEVRLLGNTTVSSAVIRNLIRTIEGQTFDPATVEEDYQRIYSLRKFSAVRAKVEPTATGVIIIFEVVEQKQIASIAYQGNFRVETSDLEGSIDMKAGQAIDPFRIALAKQTIEKIYKDKGFPFAHVTIALEDLSKTGVLTFHITEGPHVRVRRIAFEGGNSFTDDKLKDQVKTSRWLWIFRPGTFDPELIEDDVAALRQFYEEHGFFDVHVGRKVDFSADQSEVMVTFLIEEGNRYVVDTVRFKGVATLLNITEAKLRETLKLTPGRTFDNDILRRDIRQIVRQYSPFGVIYLPLSDNRDYLRVNVEKVFHKESGKVDLVYDIHEGRPFRVGRVLVKGNSKVQDKVYVRELRVAPGQLYNAGELQDATDRIRALGLVSNVTITPLGDDPDVRDVLVQIDEGQTAMFMVGAGLTSDAGVLGEISYQQKNFDITNVPTSWQELTSSRAFTGAGQYFRILLEPGTQQSRARVTFQEPYLFDQPYILGTDFYYSEAVREEWEESRAGGRVTLGKRFTPELIGRISLRAEDVKVYDVQDPQRRALDIIEREGHTTLTSAGFDLRRDTTDSPILPTKGNSTGFSWESVGALGGQATFNKFLADTSFHQTIAEDLQDRKTTLTEKFTAGYIDSQSPFFERFYGGGTQTLRGFRYRGVSPRGGPDNDPIGGNWEALGTIEANFPIVGETLRGVVFSDFGTIEPTVSLGTLRMTVGAGVRLQLPMFGQIPLALDFAVPVTDDSHDNTQVISFSLGISP